MGPLETVELSEQRPQGVTAMELVAAIGQQQDKPLLAQAAGQKRDERPRRAVGPVHVLEDQDHGRGLAEPVQQVQDRLE